MRFRIGVLDIAASMVVVVAIALPPRGTRVSPAQPPISAETAGEIAAYQARLAASPGDGAAAEELAETLVEAGYTDGALRVSGDATRDKQSPTLWRALRGVSTTHSERFEIEDALRWGEQALVACRAREDSCPAHEEIRLQIYVDQLHAGLASGIDPKADPEGFREAMSRSGIRNVRLKPPRE